MAQSSQTTGTLTWACGCYETADALIPCAKSWCMRSEMEPGAAAQPVAHLRSQIARLEAYLQVQLERRDWHGVSDAANDLRVLEAELKAHESHL